MDLIGFTYILSLCVRSLVSRQVTHLMRLIILSLGHRLILALFVTECLRRVYVNSRNTGTINMLASIALAPQDACRATVSSTVSCTGFGYQGARSSPNIPAPFEIHQKSSIYIASNVMVDRQHVHDQRCLVYTYRHRQCFTRGLRESFYSLCSRCENGSFHIQRTRVQFLFQPTLVMDANKIKIIT